MKLLNKDQLMVLNVHDLKRLVLSLRSRIKESESVKPSTSEDLDTLKELQTYYCYVFRELEHRGLV